MDGTGKKAQVKGLLIGGKTGTSKKVEKGNYSEEKKITSFIGFFQPILQNFLLLFFLMNLRKTCQ